MQLILYQIGLFKYIIIPTTVLRSKIEWHNQTKTICKAKILQSLETLTEEIPNIIKKQFYSDDQVMNATAF